MDAPEPADTPFAAVSAQTSKFGRVCIRSGRALMARLTGPTQMYQSYLDQSTPYLTYRWIGTGVLFLFFGLRILLSQGWYIGALPACE
jgi:hypothetical protein